MNIYEVVFVRRLASNVSTFTMWLDEETIGEFYEAITDAISNQTGMRTSTVRVFDVFDTEHFIQMLSWERISIAELKADALKRAVDTVTNFHKTTSHEGKVIDISSRINGSKDTANS